MIKMPENIIITPPEIERLLCLIAEKCQEGPLDDWKILFEKFKLLYDYSHVLNLDVKLEKKQ